MILFFKYFLKSGDTFQRNGKVVSKSFFSAINMTGFSLSLLSRKILIQLSVNLIGNAFIFFFLLNDIILIEILKNPKQLKTFEIIK